MAATPAILYSFRRCPYAIRARLALHAAGVTPGRDLELREVNLRAKPPELLEASAKGTVPVLVSAAGVLDESLAIMGWALQRHDPGGWLRGWGPAERAAGEALIAQNDGPFKQHLDRFKYPDRDGQAGLVGREEHRRRGLAILRQWNRELQPGGWLLGTRPSLADLALLPFVRQFRLADPEAFDAEAGLEALQAWLQRFLESAQLAVVMAPGWAPRSPWRSPGWLYHLALRSDWQAARGSGEYRISTRGQPLEQVGFMHLSQAHQVAATAERFFGDIPSAELLLLSIDPEQLRSDGVEVRLEAVPGTGELFPHLYGPLSLRAVLLAEPWR